MADTTDSVLSFTRDAAFINRRAQVRRDAGEDMDALRLYRRACEEAPDNAVYRIDLAEMLNKMGCVHASYDELNRLINEGVISLKALTQEPALRGALFMQAHSLCAMGYPSSAQTMLSILKDMPDGDMKEDCEDLSFHIMVDALAEHSSHARTIFIKRMLHFMDSDDVSHAHIAARRYLARHKASPLGHIALAWTLYRMDEQAQATEHMVRALTTMRRDPWVLYIASRILAGSDAEQAQTTLMNASILSDRNEFDRLLLRQAAALGMHSLVLDLTERILESDPGAPYPSACKSVAMFNMGSSARAALQPLHTCLKIYPGNIIASHYEALLAASPKAPLDYPDREMLRQWAGAVSAMRAHIVANSTALPVLGSKDIKLLAWGLHHAGVKIFASSAALLTHSGSNEALGELWSYLAECDAPDAFRLDALSMMSAAGMPLPRLIFLRGKLMSLNETRAARIIAGMESCRSVRIAARRMREYPDAIFDMRAMHFLAGDMELNSDEMASALECAFRIKHGEAINLREIANRREINCARLTRAVYAYLQIAGNQEEQP